MSARAALIRLIRTIIPPNITGTVVSVDLSDYTCVIKPSDGSSNFEGVRLKATVDSSTDGLVCEPEIGSEVIISPLFNNEHAFFVSRFSNVKKWHLKMVGGGQVELDDLGNVKMNGGLLGGLVIVDDLISRLNAIESKVNTHLAAYNIHTHVTSCGAGSGSAAITPNVVAGTLTPTVATQIENEKVKHG